MHYRFSVSMNYADCEALYQANIRYVHVIDAEGRRIQLDKKHIKKYLTPTGIHGVFELHVDQNNRFIELIPLHKN